jgi:CMP-N,N'-diacetyllegionaminic acid synthase
MNKTVAMIPARMNSKRVKKKNIRLLNGKPMIQYVIEAAKEADCFDEIWVNSESDVIGEIALKNGVKFYKRPSSLCGDDVGSDLFVYDFIQNVDCNLVVQILPTSPFIDPKQINEFVNLSKDYDTLVSVNPIQIESMYKGSPINFDQKKPTPPSQDLIPIEAYACSLMAWETDNYCENMSKYDSAYHGGDGDIATYQIKGYGTLDIDNEEDFQLAEAIATSLSRGALPAKYYDDDQVYDADRLQVLLDDGVTNNTMYEYNKERVSIDELINSNPSDRCWSHTLINSKSNSATLIAQMPGEGNRMHYHSDWDEWWHILAGEWEWFIEGRTVKVTKGDMVFIERNKVHKITAIGDKQAIRLAVSREDVDHIYERGDY